ncbi:zona pellucida-like domain-containing protein 1 [Synchiropus picturatus]
MTDSHHFHLVENSDISVVCGAQTMQLSIYVCPIYQAQYNETQMALNNEYNNPSCFGDVDLSADPPVLEFSFPINETSGPFCGNTFEVGLFFYYITTRKENLCLIPGLKTFLSLAPQITEEVGTGTFSQFSSVQYATISGEVVSIDPSAGTITYLPQIIYKFSCKYPMQYLLNNTQLGVSGVNLVVNDNNGSFISTLSMQLYSDEQYTQIMTMPESGIRLKTKIHVAVIATNLTVGFNVLLDRCYATTSPYPTYTTFYDLFVGCTLDKQTTVKLNGQAQVAYFSFEAFRFIDHKNLTVSVFYLHCITRLCKVSECPDLMPVSCVPSVHNKCFRNFGVDFSALNRTAAPPSAAGEKEPPQMPLPTPPSPRAPLLSANKQWVGSDFILSYELESLTMTFKQTWLLSHGLAGSQAQTQYSSPVVAVIVCIVVLTILFIGMSVYLGCYVRQGKLVMH